MNSEKLLIPLTKCRRTPGDPDCSKRVRYSDLTDNENTHWHREGVVFVSVPDEVTELFGVKL